MKKLMTLDLVFYTILPFIVWNYGREPFGDYYAMLLSTVPGFIYTIYRFILERQFNIGGLFIIFSLFLSTTVKLLSGNAENLLWNGVYLGYFYAAIYLLSILLRKPLALYFAVDFAYLQGQPREQSKALFSSKGIFKWYQMLTGLIVFRGIFQSTLKALLIYSYGVDGYGHILIYMQVSGWFFGALITGASFFVYSKVKQYIKEQYVESTEMEQADGAS